ALWRPVLTTEYDATNVAATRRFTARAFDHAGRETFVSYPEATASNWTSLTAGHRSHFDPIGRLTLSEQDSELGVLGTTTDYLGGFSKRITDPRGHSTTLQFQAFDEPSEDAPVRIDAPEGATMLIDRDRYGKPLAVTRQGY